MTPVSHTPSGWELVLAHLFDELGVGATERDAPPWEAHRALPSLLHRNERLIELVEGVDSGRGRSGPGLLVATSRRLLFAPIGDHEPERWSLRSISEARADTNLLSRARALAVVTPHGERRFRDLRPDSRVPHLLAAVTRSIPRSDGRRAGPWARSPEIARLGELAVHLDLIRLPGGGAQPVDAGVSAHVDLDGGAGPATDGSGPVTLRLEGRDWTWASELPADWLQEARLVAEAVDSAAALAGGERRATRDPVLDRLERLARLRDQGVLTEEEAQAQKARIVADGDDPQVRASG